MESDQEELNNGMMHIYGVCMSYNVAVVDKHEINKPVSDFEQNMWRGEGTSSLPYCRYKL